MPLTSEPGTINTDPIMRDQNWRPTPEELATHADRWAEWHGHDEASRQGYSTWFSRAFVNEPWHAVPPHRRAFKMYMDSLECNTRHRTHPSFLERL